MMRRLGLGLVIAATVFALADSGQAAPIVVQGTLRIFDADGDGGTRTYGNNNGGAVTYVTYWDDVSIDRVTFDVTAGTTVNFDILAWENVDSNPAHADLNGDGETTAVDSFISVWNSSNIALAVDDDGPLGSDGSFTGLDSNMNYTFASAGTYFLTISSLSNTAQSDHLAGVALDQYAYMQYIDYNASIYNSIDHADWQLTMNPTNGTISNVHVSTFDAAVPEPSSLSLLGIGVIGMVIGAARRRRRQAA